MKLRAAVDALFGEAATKRQQREAQRKNRGVLAGESEGLEDDSVGLAIAALDSNSRKVLDLFTSVQSQWQRGGMSERRLGIPRTEVENEARARGIPFGEFFRDKFSLCEAVLVQLDLTKLNEASQK